MRRVYNFGAGPAMLPEEILKRAQEDLLDWNGLGMSVMEISHRSNEFKVLLQEVQQDLRDLLAIPDNYHVLFFSAPSRSQFSMVPMNLLSDKDTADYLDTGIWSHFAYEEAKRFCRPNCVASGEAQHYTTVPDSDSWQLNPNAAYFHYTANETVNGVELHKIPTVSTPVVADMTSTILSRPIDVSRFGCIYAGAQKNIGPAGLTIVIVRDDLIGEPLPNTPSTETYAIIRDKDSLYYTANGFAIYMAGLMFKWLKAQGGLSKMAKRNACKADKLYHYIDNSDFYHNAVDVAYRSWMNIPFRLTNNDLNDLFLEKSRAAGLVALKGHRYVGGMRASIYNAMPEAGVDALLNFMQEFKIQNG